MRNVRTAEKLLTEKMRLKSFSAIEILDMEKLYHNLGARSAEIIVARIISITNNKILIN